MGLRGARLSDAPNLLEIVVRRAEIKPFVQFTGNGGILEGVSVSMPGYNLEDVIISLLDDYGRDRVIETINDIEGITSINK